MMRSRKKSPGGESRDEVPQKLVVFYIINIAP